MEFAAAHYVFHCEKNSTAEKDIAEIIARQEECYSFISNSLRTTAKGKIHYHLFDTPEEVGRQYAIAYNSSNDRPCNGFALPEMNSKDGANHIFAVYNETVKCIGFHEDAHIISYSLGKPVSQFIREGLAMFFDRYWWGVDNYSWTQWYIEQGEAPAITALLENDNFVEYSEMLTYPIAGAFTGYLFDRFGAEKYIEFYRCSVEKGTQAFAQIFGATVSVLEKNFIAYIKTFRLREEIRKLLTADTEE